MGMQAGEWGGPRAIGPGQPACGKVWEQVRKAALL